MFAKIFFTSLRNSLVFLLKTLDMKVNYSKIQVHYIKTI